MEIIVKPKMRKALEKLRYECDYENHKTGDTDNYILRGKLGAGIGEKTLSDLKLMGLLETGTNRWFKCEGYRITEAGRELLKR